MSSLLPQPEGRTIFKIVLYDLSTNGAKIANDQPRSEDEGRGARGEGNDEAQMSND